jgi:hypothetical protein
MAWMVDYWKLKRAYAALNEENFSAAFKHFLSCKRTSKLSFNLAVLCIWQNQPKQIIRHFLLDALKRDPFLAIAAFYLGVIENKAEYFEQSLDGFRDCKFIDYTEIGLPFILDHEDVLFNLVSLQSPLADPSALNNLTIQSIGSLLLNQLNNPNPNTTIQNGKPQFHVPPFKDRKMIFNLLPKIEPEPLELKGPEHVTFIQGEEDYFSGFPDAHIRQIKMNFLNENK